MGLLKKRNEDELTKSLVKLCDALKTAVEYGDLPGSVEIKIEARARCDVGKNWKLDVDCEVAAK